MDQKNETRSEAKSNKNLETMMKRLNTLGFYIDSGRSLNDKDRNNNNDLSEIFQFFEPIHRLYGDYEIRKKLGIEQVLYRNDTQGGPAVITRDEIRKLASNGYLILLIVCQDPTTLDLRVNYCWIKINKVDGKISETEPIKYSKNAKTALNIDPEIVKNLYVLEPAKLNRTIDLDDARYRSYQNALLEKIDPDFYTLDEAEQKEWYDQIDEVVRLKSTQQEMDFSALSVSPEISEAFSHPEEEIKPLVKLKNFEKFEHVKIRLGQYKDGRYVIYLHPYNGESNCPIRIPCE